MIPGVIASALAPSSGNVPGWVPEGAIAHLDFTTQRYFASGSQRAISAVLTGYDEADIDGSGARIVGPSNGNRPAMTGFLLADVAAHFAACTIIMELSASDTEGMLDVPLLLVMDNVSQGSANWGFEMRGIGSGIVSFEDLAGGAYLESTAVTGSGTQKIGMTVGREVSGPDWEWALSINGEAAYTGNAGFVSEGDIIVGQLGPDAAYAFSFTGFFIRKVTLYPAVDPTALAALTA